MGESSTEFSFNPIMVTSQDFDTVTFKIGNPFGADVQAVFYQYTAAETIGTKCYSEAPFTSCAQPIEVTAHCMTSGARPLALVDLWFVDPVAVDSSDTEVVPECCHPNEQDASVPTVLYTFKVYCKSKCPDNEPARRLDNTKTAHDLSRVLTKEGGSIEPIVLEEGKEHFCSALEYPCGDKKDKLVHVCHYSSKEGYQTYCVPESDSDVLAYAPKDYCGPCVGGYSQTN
jgi:hypothetical protein